MRITAETEGKLCSDAKADMNIIVGNVPLEGRTEGRSPIERTYKQLSVPTGELRKGYAAVRWSDDLDKEFAPLFPYFGLKSLEGTGVITIDKN